MRDPESGPDFNSSQAPGRIGRLEEFVCKKKSEHLYLNQEKAAKPQTPQRMTDSVSPSVPALFGILPARASLRLP